MTCNKELPLWRGLGEELYEWLLKIAPMARPYFAHASIISTLGPILGNLYTSTGGNLVTYQLLIAKSGSGKDFYLKAAKKIFAELELDYVGLGNYRSDASLIETLPAQRVRLDTIDEASSLFITASKASTGAQANITNILTELWSIDGVYPGMRTRQDGVYGNCLRPCVNFIGAMTASSFQECFNQKYMDAGFGGRFLYFHDQSTGSLNKSFLDNINKPFPESLKKQLLHLSSLKDSSDQVEPKPARLPIKKDARARLEEIREELFQLSSKCDDFEPMLPIYNRSFEYITRLMVYYTVSKDVYQISPFIELESVEWAYKFVMILNHNNKRSLFSTLSETRFEKDCRKVLHIINSKGGQITRSVLIRNSRLRAKYLDDIVHHLIEARQVDRFNQEKEINYISLRNFDTSKGGSP